MQMANSNMAERAVTFADESSVIPTDNGGASSDSSSPAAPGIWQQFRQYFKRSPKATPAVVNAPRLDDTAPSALQANGQGGGDPHCCCCPHRQCQATNEGTSTKRVAQLEEQPADRLNSESSGPVPVLQRRSTLLEFSLSQSRGSSTSGYAGDDEMKTNVSGPPTTTSSSKGVKLAPFVATPDTNIHSGDTNGDSVPDDERNGPQRSNAGPENPSEANSAAFGEVNRSVEDSVIEPRATPTRFQDFPRFPTSAGSGISQEDSTDGDTVTANPPTNNPEDAATRHNLTGEPLQDIDLTGGHAQDADTPIGPNWLNSGLSFGPMVPKRRSTSGSSTSSCSSRTCPSSSSSSFSSGSIARKSTTSRGSNAITKRLKNYYRAARKPSASRIPESQPSQSAQPILTPVITDHGSNATKSRSHHHHHHHHHRHDARPKL
ncbi:hypothetical protein TRVA0_025S00760 [Trichomonascus vanleenenianus]|uniref:uncharacterized protein n=1 Tax=Trichomonascus vanleenenianus TaxID=2268995 RepID=UPI003ECB0DBE